MTSVAPPICVGCKNLQGDLRKPHCKAFPAGIPWEILESSADHRKPFPGDRNIRFEAKTDADEKYAEQVLGPRDASHPS